MTFTIKCWWFVQVDMISNRLDTIYCTSSLTLLCIIATDLIGSEIHESAQTWTRKNWIETIIERKQLASKLYLLSLFVWSQNGSERVCRGKNSAGAKPGMYRARRQFMKEFHPESLIKSLSSSVCLADGRCPRTARLAWFSSAFVEYDIVLKNLIGWFYCGLITLF